MTREAEEKEKRLRGDLEKLKSQHEQTLGTLDTRIDAKLERRTQAIMDRSPSNRPGYHGQVGRSPGKQERI